MTGDMDIFAANERERLSKREREDVTRLSSVDSRSDGRWKGAIRNVLLARSIISS